MVPFEFIKGSTPLIVSMPHNGTWIPADIAQHMTELGQASGDADHFQFELYDFAKDLGATIIASGVSRYVIDLNRPKNDHSLYPGQFTTGLCPLVTFKDEPLYQPEYVLTPEERNDRLLKYWLPYHETLAEAIATTLDRHGRAILYDAHSIAAEVPLLFEGTLPNLNIGTNGGTTVLPETLQLIESTLAAQDAFSFVVDGRFKGGHITRNYATPALGVQTVQMELTKDLYMDEGLNEGGSGPTFAPDKARPLQDVLRQLLEALLRQADT